MKKIKVLIVAGTMDVGGIENQLMHLIRNADPNQFQIDFTSTMENPFYKKEIESLGGRCFYIPSTVGRNHLAYCKALYILLKKEKYDIVHSHELFHSGMVLRIAKAAGVKNRFAHAHSSNQKYRSSFVKSTYRKLMRHWILSCGTEYFACSSWAAEFLYGEKILSSAHYHLVVNSVDTEEFLNDRIPIDIDDSFFDGWKNIIQVGRFSDEKNFLLTAELAKECKRRNNGIRFLCVGNNGNDYEKKVRDKINEYQIEEQMVLMGVRKDVAQLMKRVDGFLLPSKYEGMPLTLIEAQASCLPCVVADTFSHEVDFNIGSLEWVNIKADSSEWVDTLEKSLNKGLTNKTQSMETIKKYGFDSKDFSTNICSIYQNVCKNY